MTVPFASIEEAIANPRSNEDVQGLADAFIMLRLPFTSDEAKQLNQEIFETLYYAALSASMELAKEDREKN